MPPAPPDSPRQALRRALDALPSALDQEREIARLQAQLETAEERLREAKEDKDFLKGHLVYLVLQLQESERQRIENEQRRHEAEHRVAVIYRSVSWRVTMPLRVLSRLARRLAGRGAPVARPEGEARDYAAWIAHYDSPTAKQLAALTAKAEAKAGALSFAVVGPTDDDGPAVRSLKAQAWRRWRLVSAADLEGVSEPWVLALDPDDRLAPHALATLALAIAAAPEAVLAYGDEDRQEGDGRADPLFKPDWNPEWMLGADLPGAAVAWKREAILAAGGWQSGGYDLSLRIAERATPATLLHVPHVLVHAGKRDGLAPAAGAAAVARHLERTGQPGRAEASASGWRIRRGVPERAPRISVLVPTRDRGELVRVCVEGLLKQTDWPDLEVLVVDNSSSEPATLALFEELKQDGRVRILPHYIPFNYSALNNFAAAQATGELLLLLNNDIEIIHPEWLAEMAGLAMREDVGAVGAKLLYPDRTTQHAGVLIGRGGLAGHMLHRLEEDDPGPGGRAARAQDLSAVTAACLLTRADVYRRLEGFDETLAVAFNDVDYCLRVRRAGLRVVWTPHATLIHHESVSRGSDHEPKNVARAAREATLTVERWGDVLKEDPFFSPNLDMNLADGTPAFPPRVVRPWAD